MHATDTRDTRQESRQTNLRTFGFTTADQLRFDNLDDNGAGHDE